MKLRECYGYIRVSTPRQGGEKSASLPEQRDVIQRYADEHGLIIVRWFVEEETAAKAGRPGFNEMLRLLKQGKAQGVIVHKLDRSTRNYSEWEDIYELIDSGIEVHFAVEKFDLRTTSGKLAADINMVMAVHYIRNLRDETKKGQMGRLKQGILPWKAPPGYLNKGRGQLKEIDPIKGPLIRMVFELYATGKYTMLSLAEEMYKRGLTNSAGRKFTIEGISAILSNPFYAGVIRVKRTGESFPGRHEPLISKELLDRVQDIIHGRSNRTPPKHNFLFSRILKCRVCRRSLRGEIQKARVYYRCHTKACPSTCLREDRVETEIIEQLEPLRFTEEEKQYTSELVDRYRQDSEKETRIQSEAITIRLQQVRDRLNRLTDAYVDQSIPKSVFANRNSSLLMEEKDLQQKLLEVKEGSLADSLEDVLNQASIAASAHKEGTPEEKRDLLRVIASNLLGNDAKNVELVLLPPFAEIARRSQIDPKSEGNDDSGNPAPPNFPGDQENLDAMRLPAFLPVRETAEIGQWCQTTDYRRIWDELIPKLIALLSANPITIPDDLKSPSHDANSKAT